MPAYSFVGKDVLRVDAQAKVTGEAIFTTDMALPGMLCGKILRSPYPFARIVSVNTARAGRLAGVRAVITAGDVTQCPFGSVISDELPLADKYVRYFGDQVAAVAAVDEETAEEAMDLIKVEYEELTPLLSPEEAMRPGALAIHPEREEVKFNIARHYEFVRGKGEAAFKEADLVVEDRFSTQPQHHAYLETQTSIAQWDSSGRLTIWASTQSPSGLRNLVAQALGIAVHRIRVIQPYVGGGFGGKIYGLGLHPISALLARKAGKPVKIVYTREEDFIAGRPRVSEVIDLKLGFKKDGTMVGKSLKITGDAGAYAGVAANVVAVSMVRSDCLYRLANIKAEANIVYTNKIPRTAFRGFGNPEMLFAMESLIDVAAERLGIDPTEIRLRNASQKGDITAHGWILNSCGLSESIRLAAQKAGWKGKKQKRKVNYGIGLACQVHVSGRLHDSVHRGSSAIINIDQYGRVKVVSGESEIGQGMLTVFAQIAAEELGINMQDIEVAPFVDTDSSPFGRGTFGSRVTLNGGNAVLLAAKDVRKQLLKHAAEKLELRPNELELKDSKFYVKGVPKAMLTLSDLARNVVIRKMGGVPITGRGEYLAPDYVMVDDKSLYGNYSVAYAFSTQIAEVEVDPETGKVDVLDIWVAEDVGKAINPKLCEGQVEGAVAQGIGFALREDYLWEKGKLLNPHFSDYKLQVFAGTPRIHSFWVETNEPGGPFGAKSIGEAAGNPTAVAIANAIYNAIGIRFKDFPITPEKIVKALAGKKPEGK